MDDVDPPNYIPKHVRKHYSSAVIIGHAGMMLPALFMLRTVIEQFWVSLGLRKEGERLTGEELGTRYKKRLTDAFKQHFPSLSDIYDSISTALHTANPDADLFMKSMEELNEHFDARRLFKLDGSSPETLEKS